MIIGIDDALAEKFSELRIAECENALDLDLGLLYLLKRLIRARVPANVSKRDEGYERVS